MATVTTSTNSANLHSYFVKKLLSVLQPNLVLYPLGKKTALPEGNGKQVKWLQYTRVSGSSTALTEGVIPSEISVTSANVTATIAQYGQFAKISDLFDMTAIDGPMKEFMELFGRAGAETVEDLIAAELEDTLTQAWVPDATSGAANANDDALAAADVATLKQFIKQMVALKIAYVGPHEQGKYIVVLHPAAQYDLMADVNTGGWVDVNKYVGLEQKNIMRGEIGSAYGMRFTSSDKMLSVANASAVSVKSNYILGEECFGVVDLGGKNVQIISKPHGSGGTSDPLNQIATVGYKIQGFVAKNFAAGRGRNLRCAASL